MKNLKKFKLLNLHCIFALLAFCLVPTGALLASEVCNMGNNGDFICPSVGDASSPSADPSSSSSSTLTGASIFGNGSPLFSSFGGSSSGMDGIFAQLSSTLDGIGDVLKNLLISQAVSLLSSLTGNDAISQLGDMISQFTQLNSIMDSFSGMNVGGVNVGGDLQSYLTNNIAQQVASGGDITSQNILDTAQNALGNISSSVDNPRLEGCDEALLNVVQSAESTCGGGKSHYEIVWGCRTPTTADGRPLSQMTIAEVQNWQAGDAGHSAAGRYQFVPDTLNDLVAKEVAAGNISTSDTFDAGMQDYLAINLADSQGGLAKYKAGQQSLDRTIYKIATIWAGLEYAPGKGVYDGYAGNDAKDGTYGQVKAALESC